MCMKWTHQNKQDFGFDFTNRLLGTEDDLNSDSGQSNKITENKELSFRDQTLLRL